MRLAAEGKLRDAKVRRTQVERMINDPRIPGSFNLITYRRNGSARLAGDNNLVDL